MCRNWPATRNGPIAGTPSESLLDDIFRVLRSAGHPVRKTVDGPAVTVHERPESFAIAVAGQRDSGGVRLRHPSRLDGAWGWGLAAIRPTCDLLRATCYVRRATTSGARKGGAIQTWGSLVRRGRGRGVRLKARMVRGAKSLAYVADRSTRRTIARISAISPCNAAIQAPASRGARPWGLRRTGSNHPHLPC